MFLCSSQRLSDTRYQATARKQVGTTFFVCNIARLFVRRHTHIRLNDKHKLAGFRNGIRKGSVWWYFALAAQESRHSDNSAFLLIGKRSQGSYAKLVAFLEAAKQASPSIAPCS